MQAQETAQTLNPKPPKGTKPRSECFPLVPSTLHCSQPSRLSSSPFSSSKLSTVGRSPPLSPRLSKPLARTTYRLRNKNQRMKNKKSSKKRAAQELDTLAMKDKVEIGHGEAADGVLVDQDLNEPTMGEKLASLNLVPDDRVESQNKEDSSLHAKPPSADSVHILLEQALHADDRALLLDCLYTQDEKVIAKSVSLLNPAGVLKLLQALISLIESRGAILACALPWLRSLLLQHASGIVSHESSLSALNSLYQLIESRVSTFQSALQLSSVLDLLYSGVVDDLDDENGTTGPVVYEDKDESDEEESDDAMETDQDDEDEEELDAKLGGVSDFEGIEGLDDLSD